MTDTHALGPLRRFLEEHLVSERNLARNTQLSYRDTLALLLPHRRQGAHAGRPANGIKCGVANCQVVVPATASGFGWASLKRRSAYVARR